MIVSHKTRSIFIHIQRTGGSSVEEAIRKTDSSVGSHLYQGKRHLFARDAQHILGSDIWNSYYKFAFVRNPWDRLVSWYYMCMQNPVNKFTKYVKENAPTFSDFITKTTTGLAEKTTYNQLDFISDEKGDIIVDFVGKYENLQEDFSVVAKQLSMSAHLPHVNKSRHKSYRNYYAEETREIVRKRCEKDITYFGYEF